MKIQEVARRTGLSIPTLRYYEEIGLVTPIPREQNGHRDYTEDDVYRLIFVTRLRATGMPLARIQRYTTLAQKGGTTVQERLEILEEHQIAVEKQIADLCEHLDLIRGKIAHYRELHTGALAPADSPPLPAEVIDA